MFKISFTPQPVLVSMTHGMCTPRLYADWKLFRPNPYLVNDPRHRLSVRLGKGTAFERIENTIRS
ncbi:hypothetical protein D3C72_2300510 [compost metagenome]